MKKRNKCHFCRQKLFNETFTAQAVHARSSFWLKGNWGFIFISPAHGFMYYDDIVPSINHKNCSEALVIKKVFSYQDGKSNPNYKIIIQTIHHSLVPDFIIQFGPILLAIVGFPE